MELVVQQRIAHACILAVASEPCLHPGDHLKDRVQPVVSQSKLRTDAFGTWMPSGAEWLTVGRYGDSTLVYIPSQDAFYYASPACALSAKCPDKTVFLGQFVLDHDSTPRILMHDLIRLQGVSCAEMPSRERYACLQQLGVHFVGALCALQWVGECKALEGELKSGKFKVPHHVKGIMALSPVPGRVTLAE